MSDKLTAVLFNPVQGHKAIYEAWLWAKAMLVAGHRLSLEIRASSKTREQEEKYHAILGEIHSAFKAAGKDMEREDVKRLFLEQFAEETARPKGKLLASLDGKRLVQTQLQSRKFTKTDGNEFIEWLHAWCAENGVELSQ